MRVLAFSDIHGDWNALSRLLSFDADAFIGVGDATNGDRDEFLQFLRMFSGKRLLYVPGNNELPNWIPLDVSLHERKVGLGGITIGGLGGSPKTPFNTIFEWEEEYAYKALEKLGYVDVLVSHTPPKGTDHALTYSGIDAGSEAIKWYMETYEPRLILTGHIHERGGLIKKYGNTVVANPYKRGVIVRLPELSIEPI